MYCAKQIKFKLCTKNNGPHEAGKADENVFEWNV